MLLLLLSCFSRVRLLATPQTAAYQAPLSMAFSRQEYWSGVPLPSPLSHTALGKSQSILCNTYIHKLSLNGSPFYLLQL